MTNSLVLNTIKVYDFFTTAHDLTSPAHPAEATGRAIRFGLLASVATIGVFLVGGSLAPLQSAAASHGQIMPTDYKKTVQHLEGGIIESILVKDGDVVAAGQPLIRLSKTGPSASQGVANTQYFTSRVTQARLEALQNGDEEMALGGDLQKEADADPDLKSVLASQQKLFVADRDAQRDKRAMYEQQIGQVQQEKEGLQARLKSTQAQLAMLEESLTSERDLVERGLSTRPRLLNLESQAEELQGKIGEYNANIGKTDKSVMEVNVRISNEKNEFQARVAEQLRAARETSIELEKKLASATDILDRTVIAAPIAGTVNGLKFHTVGGVIPPGSPVLDIIPKDDQVLVDAEILPRDISRVHIGQDAKIIFSAYKSRITPMIKGKVIQVSADRLVPSNAQSASPAAAGGYYLARVEVDREEMKHLATPIPLTPGMPVEVMVVDGERSLLGYYFKPFTDSFRRAFLEQ